MSDFERMLREAKLAEAGEQDKQQLQQGEEEGVCIRVRVQIIRHARTNSVGKYQSCMF